MEKTTLYGRLSQGNISGRSNSFSWMNKNTILDFIRLLLIVILIYSSIRKILSFKSYSDEIIFYLQNIRLVTMVAWVEIIRWCTGVLCFVELIAAIALSFSKSRQLGFGLAFAAMIIVLLYLLTILQISYAISDYFGSIFPFISYAGHLIITMCLMLISAICFIMQKQNFND